MWFKNLRLYCLAQPFDLPLEQFESQLAELVFVPCSNYEKSRIGWVNPLGDAAPEVNAGAQIIDENGEAILRFKSGVIASIAAGWLDLAQPMTAQVSGTKAHAYVAQDELYLVGDEIPNADGQSPHTDLPENLSSCFTNTGKDIHIQVIHIVFVI